MSYQHYQKIFLEIYEPFEQTEADLVEAFKTGQLEEKTREAYTTYARQSQAHGFVSSLQAVKHAPDGSPAHEVGDRFVQEYLSFAYLLDPVKAEAMMRIVRDALQERPDRLQVYESIMIFFESYAHANRVGVPVNFENQDITVFLTHPHIGQEFSRIVNENNDHATAIALLADDEESEEALDEEEYEETIYSIAHETADAQTVLLSGEEVMRSLGIMKEFQAASPVQITWEDENIIAAWIEHFQNEIFYQQCEDLDDEETQFYIALMNMRLTVN